MFTALYKPNLACRHIKWKENLIYWKQTTNLEKLHTFIIFCAFGDFYSDVIERKCPYLQGSRLRCPSMLNMWYFRFGREFWLSVRPPGCNFYEENISALESNFSWQEA